MFALDSALLRSSPGCLGSDSPIYASESAERAHRVRFLANVICLSFRFGERHEYWISKRQIASESDDLVNG
jgi:hypothetical protein